MSTVQTDNERKQFLLPGELAYCRKPTLLSTLLGSCVAICLYDKKNRWGGMNHYMLPFKNNGTMVDGKYGDTAFKSLVRLAKASGSVGEDVVASVYGGGNVMGHLGSARLTGQENIGDKNARVALEMLKKMRIRVIHKELGGVNGRRINMNTDTNEIKSALIERSEETEAREKIQKKFSAGGSVGVLIVDDSSTVRALLRSGIEAAEGIHVVGEAENPYEAREKLLELNPDVLCLDVIMPKMDGLTFLKKLMQFKPIPTVICSTIAKEGSKMYDNLKEAGAVHVIDKENLDLYKRKEVMQEILVPKLMAAARTMVRQVKA
ncbi:MAG: hypothetical protein COA73_02290 [Candidatus Hydrogenedentota bacterium]|nr:MAG: hypothetical protein COA73_02290 [Candidatus Hydrogenedentota bacterium]